MNLLDLIYDPELSAINAYRILERHPEKLEELLTNPSIDLLLLESTKLAVHIGKLKALKDCEIEVSFETEPSIRPGFREFGKLYASSYILGKEYRCSVIYLDNLTDQWEFLLECLKADVLS